MQYKNMIKKKAATMYNIQTTCFVAAKKKKSIPECFHPKMSTADIYAEFQIRESLD